MDSAEQATWYDVIGRFKAMAAQFDASFNALVASDPPDDPALAAERDALIDRGTSINNTVSSIRTALADVSAALSGAWDQVTGAWDWIAGNIGMQGYSGGGLGFPPLIPIAIVAGALTAITLFLTDFGKYRARLAAYNATIAAGGSPEQASSAVAAASEADTGGTVATLSHTATTVAYVGLAGLALWLFFGRRKS